MSAPEVSATTAAAAINVDTTNADTATATATAPNRPSVLIVSHTLSGHLAPMLRIASALSTRSWPVFFLGPTAHQARIEATGAVFLPLRGDADLDDRAYYENPPVPGYNALPWYERVLVDLERQCVATLPTQWACLREAVRDLYLRSNGRQQVLVLAEAFFFGALPLRHGAPLLPLPTDVEGAAAGAEEMAPRPRSICVSVTVPCIRSRDLPPFGYTGFPFDTSAEGRGRNARLWERSWARRAAGLTALLEAKMREVGAAEPLVVTNDNDRADVDGGEEGAEKIFLEGENYLCHERILQLGVPGFEYPRSDWPEGFRFAGLAQGGVVKGGTDPDFPWWSEIVANSALERGDHRRKKVVVVTQGTVEINPEELILPTVRAFDPSISISISISISSSSSPSPSTQFSANDVLVIAILGWKGARLTYTTTTAPTRTDTKGEEQQPLPPNARTADYLSYDAALAHADVWVHNGGFGAVCHGIAHGVPMVVAGEGMDKGENARRVAWSGIGVDLGCVRPSTEQVREAVGRVLFGGGREGRDGERGGFKERVEALRRESEGLDCGGIVEEELLRLVG